MLDSKANPPGPRGLPLVGNALEVRGQDILQYWIGLHGAYGPVVKLKLGPMPAYSFAAAPEIYEVLVTLNKQMAKGMGYAGLRLLLGEGLITTDLPQWASQRQKLNPLFTPAAIEGYAGSVHDALIRAIGELLPEDAQSGEIDITEAMTRLTMRVISGAAFGVDLGQNHKHVADAINFTFGFVADLTSNPLRIPLFVPTVRNQRYKRALAVIDDFIAGLIRDAKTSPDTRSMSGQIFEALKENDEKLLRDEVISLYFAGYETTARAMTFALHLLASHPEVMARVRAEAQGFAKPESDVEVMRRLPFAAEVASEVLRLYPPVAMMARQPKEDCIIGGYEVKAGSLVVIHPYLAQRDPDYWPEPSIFAPDPEVPLPKRLKHRGAFVPFGGGPRLCLGKQFAMVEMTLAIALMVQRFDWTTDGTEDLALSFNGTIRPAEDVKAQLIRI